MQRITITIDDGLAQELDRRAQARGYQNRSEAVRDLVRAGIAQTQEDNAKQGAAQCVATLTYVYDQRRRDLPKRLANIFREHHDLSVATLRATLDHDSCIEVSLLRGTRSRVERLAGRITAERDVRHGRLVVIPAEIDNARHAHGKGQAQTHQHVRVL